MLRYMAVAAAAVILLVGCGKKNTTEEVGYPQVTTDIVTATLTQAPVTTTTETLTTVAETETSAPVTAAEEVTSAPATEEETFADFSENTYVEYKFRSKKQRDQHFEKHGGEFGAEFGYSSPEEYEAGASDVINDPAALYKTEAEDGDHVYYIEATNEFVILSTDGYIRTYFRPSAGKKYFDRQ